MTDREFAQHVLDRQELLIKSLHGMLDIDAIIRDTCFEIRNTLQVALERSTEDLMASIHEKTALEEERHAEVLAEIAEIRLLIDSQKSQ